MAVTEMIAQAPLPRETARLSGGDQGGDSGETDEGEYDDGEDDDTWDRDRHSFDPIVGRTSDEVVFGLRDPEDPGNPAKRFWPPEGPLWRPVRAKIMGSQFFGLFNMSRCQPCCLPKGREQAKTRLFDAVFKVLPLLLVLVQVAIPTTLFRNSVKEHVKEMNATLITNGTASALVTSGFALIPTCHKDDGDWNRKILMAAVGLFYVVRMTLLWIYKGLAPFLEHCQTEAETTNMNKTKLIEPNSVIAWWGLLDYIMAVPFEFMLYIFNLWIVYNETSFFDMVLNALAFEFVMNIDNEYKELYFKQEEGSGNLSEDEAHCDATTMNVIYNYLYQNDDTMESTGLCARFYFVLRNVIFVVSNIIAGAALVASVTAATVGAVCKK